MRTKIVTVPGGHSSGGERIRTVKASGGRCSWPESLPKSACLPTLAVIHDLLGSAASMAKRSTLNPALATIRAALAVRTGKPHPMGLAPGGCPSWTVALVRAGRRCSVRRGGVRAGAHCYRRTLCSAHRGAAHEFAQRRRGPEPPG